MVEKQTVLVVSLVFVIVALLSTLLWYVFKKDTEDSSSVEPTAPVDKSDTYKSADNVTAYVGSGLLTDDAPPDPADENRTTRAIFIDEEEPGDVREIVDAINLHERDPGIAFDLPGGGEPSSPGGDSMPGLVTERRNSIFMTYQGARPTDVDHRKFRVMGVAGKKDKTYVFGKRDSTGFYSIIKRVRVPFHSVFAVEQDREQESAALVVGETGLPAAETEPPFLFDSGDKRMLMPEVYLNADNLPVGRAAMELMITARHIEYEFIVRGSTYRIRIIICPFPEESGKYGDIVIDTGDNEFMWYDQDGKYFTSDRPENPSRLVDQLTFENLEEIYTRSTENVLPIPVSLLTSPIDWDAIRETKGNINVLIELSTDTVLMFSSTPPTDMAEVNMHEWIVENVAFPALTSNILAVVKIEY